MSVRRRPVLLLGVVGAALALARHRRAAQSERDVWTRATDGPTAAPDLR
jgi:hypothetical protein